MRLRSLRRLVAFSFSAALIVLMAGCTVAEIGRAQAEALEPIYFELGEESGQLNYEYDPMGMHSLPEAMVLDGAGNYHFLEQSSGRVQKFDPAGEFIAELAPPDELAAAESAYPVGLAPTADGDVTVLWATELPDDDALVLELLRYDSDAQLSSRTKLVEAPEPIVGVNGLMICDQGFLWVEAERRVYIFTPEGYFNARVEGEIVGYDPTGFVVIRSSGLSVYNRQGAERGKLRSVEGEEPAKFLVIDRAGLGVGRQTAAAETQTDTTIEYTNEVVLFRIDREELVMTPLGTIALPPTKYRFPSEESDLALAEQVLLPGTARIAGDTLHVLAYSEERFWVCRFGLDEFRK